MNQHQTFETPSPRWLELMELAKDCPSCGEGEITDPLCYQCEHDLETLALHHHETEE